MLKFNLRNLLIATLVLSLMSCGFHLRGAADISFNSIFIQGNTLVINKDLNKSLKSNDIKILSSAEGAELLLDLIGEESEKRILSIGGQGTVNEFELYYRVHYRTKQAGAELWSQTQTVESRRDFTYSDANLLAKQREERRLNDDMQADVVRGIMRRLSALKK
jgi:LPS-assembly lipoprotein